MDAGVHLDLQLAAYVRELVAAEALDQEQAEELMRRARALREYSYDLRHPKPVAEKPAPDHCWREKSTAKAKRKKAKA